MSIPEYLVLGHVTRDLLPGGGTAPGGTALYAALTAHRLGVRAGILTAAEQIPGELPSEISIVNIPTATTSTFENRYTPTGRQQWLHAAAPALAPEALPEAWYDVPMVHLGPVLHECTLAMLDAFPRARVIATPQGWMRRWDASLPAPIQRIPWEPEPALLGRLSAVILSIEDVEGDEQVAVTYAQHCPLVALTRSKQGATLYVEGTPHHIPAHPADERDPTGAGDVFAAALLVRLHETDDPFEAAHFAAAVAAASVEGHGSSAIPTREDVKRKA